MSLKLLIVILHAATVVHSEGDDYVNELQQRCNVSRKVYHCSKYKVLDLIDNYSLQPNAVPRTFGSILRFVRIPSPNFKAGYFGFSRHLYQDTEINKILKFFQRKANQFLSGQGVALPLPDDVQIIEGDNSVGEARQLSKSKKSKGKEMLIPLLILFKLFKIKVLVAIVLAGIFFIKKTILIAALILPSVIQSLKNHCKASYHVVQPHHYEEEHEETSGPGWGYSGYGGKEWNRNNNQQQRIGHMFPSQFR